MSLEEPGHVFGGALTRLLIASGVLVVSLLFELFGSRLGFPSALLHPFLSQEIGLVWSSGPSWLFRNGVSLLGMMGKLHQSVSQNHF